MQSVIPAYVKLKNGTGDPSLFMNQVGGACLMEGVIAFIWIVSVGLSLMEKASLSLPARNVRSSKRFAFPIRKVGLCIIKSII